MHAIKEIDTAESPVSAESSTAYLETQATRNGSPRVFLMGYNGANNAGSEARLLAVIQDLRSVLGPSARITLPTLNEAKQSRYLEADAHLHVLPFRTFSVRAVIKAARVLWSHDIVLLTEGSCYMDTWSSALLYLYLGVTRCAAAMSKPSLAYSVDSGQLAPRNLKRVRRQANRTRLIIARSQPAADRLRSWGVTAPIEVTADTAFSLQIEPPEENPFAGIWSQVTSGVVGMALLDFYRWPVVFRLWGRSRDCYRWPMYFSSSKTRRHASEQLAKGFAAEADRIVETYDRHIALLCMEELDVPLARAVHLHMVHRDRAYVFSSSECNLRKMTSILRSLDALVSSRYHACVFATSAGVPMVAVGHDLRIMDLFRELKLPEDVFIPHDCADLETRLRKCVDNLLLDSQALRQTILQGHRLLKGRAMRNRALLKDFVEGCGWRCHH